MSMTRRLRRTSGEDGIGLVLVLGMGAILTGFMIVSTSAAIRSLSSSRLHVSFESALAVADGGIDTGLARAQKMYVTTGSDSYTIPATANPNESCVASPIAWPWAVNVQPTPEQERSWARTQLDSLATVPGCLQTGTNGQYAILKPTGRQAIYAMGWSPRRGAAEVKQRLIKAEYLFTPYSPAFAILTGGDIILDSSTTVTSAPPNSPALAAVHTNGAITVSSGNPTVAGTVTQSSSGPSASSNKFAGNSGGNVTGAARQNIPFEGAQAVWARNRATSPPGGWYDLCPNGTVQTPTGTAPCVGGTVLVTLTGSSTFRGWSFDGSGPVPVWSAGSDIKVNGFSGTYYVHRGDVVNPASNTGSPVPNLTVLASSTSLACDKVGGNITWGSTDPAAPSLPNTWLIADQDLKTESNYQAGSAVGGTVISGFFIAGDQLEMSTSSSGAYGAVISLDQCDPATGSLVAENRIKNPAIYYDPNAQAPFTDVINNTLWLEY